MIAFFFFYYFFLLLLCYVPRLLLTHSQSFLENGVASASIIAVEDTSVHIIEAYYLAILFQHFPVLAGRYAHGVEWRSIYLFIFS
jgi:hypothetical protein